MSEHATLVTTAHAEYLAAHTRDEDAFLRSLKDAALTAGIPAIWIAPEQASFIQILLRLVTARTVIEVGTLAGYSAISMARALPPGGHVHTIEIDPKHADFATEWISRSDVKGAVTVHLGPGADVLARFATGSADAAFVDADKTGYVRYLAECKRILRPGGLLMVDNAFAFGRILETDSGDRDVNAIRDFNDRMARDNGLQAVIVPLGDAMWVGVKL